ncbi:MAG: winged helix-turn-helix domain-containing protein [Burkholderiales bacterium]|nr:winged helix-turn-helix domain-containing protein [Burkholderiales bacterium]
MKSRIAPTKFRILSGDDIAMGPGKSDLIAAIEATGSISQAAKQLGMSYRRAWTLVDTMNRCFKEPLVTTATGGDHGGGARVTDFGREVLRRFNAMQAKADAAISADVAAFSKLMR